jgi:TatD DNase family protein
MMHSEGESEIASSFILHSSSSPPPPSFIDTHAHLDLEDFQSDRDAVLARAREAGVEAIVCPGVGAASSEAVVRLAAALDGVFAAVGIQPNYCAEAKPEDWDQIVALASQPRVVALGETGLDRHWDYTPFALQQDYFYHHLRLAQTHDLPLIIHCREAEADVLHMLRAVGRLGPLRGVLHSFSGDRAFAEACLELGLYLSFSGAATYTNKKFTALRDAAAMVPADRMLLETDSPYLVPHPLRGKLKRNEPSHVVLTARFLAELRGRSVEDLAAQTTANARQLFGLS